MKNSLIKAAGLCVLMIGNGLQAMDVPAEKPGQAELNSSLLSAATSFIGSLSHANDRNAKKYADEIERLIRKGADANARDRYGLTALSTVLDAQDNNHGVLSDAAFSTCAKLLIDAMIKPTPAQVKSVVALLGIKKFRQGSPLDLAGGRDTIRLIGEKQYNDFKELNKANVRNQIMQNLNSEATGALRQELLDYLNSK